MSVIELNVLDELIALRRELHQYPELSGEEENTANRIKALLETCSPSQIIDQIGGHGIAAIFDSETEGPSVLFRCELDALPIFEVGQPKWRSKEDGKAHLCGHDGHMSIICGLARHFAENPPRKGRIILLFQPAEENGAGASAIINDPKFSLIKPDYAFALHNLPGRPLHEIGVKSGPFNFASEGLIVNLVGKTSHASHPEDGISPASAVAEILAKLPNVPQELGYDHRTALCTLISTRMGGKAFGVTPADARIKATLRSSTNAAQQKLMHHMQELVKQVARRNGLGVTLNHREKFLSCQNDPEATNYIKKAAKNCNLALDELQEPFRWSEDFGNFSLVAKTAMFVLGAGQTQPQLHNSDYDFPEELIETGMKMFVSIADELCG
ncbi:amidohydrolase [Lentilitoribacter sp. EG35]|uniref:amidohydrolase n=1 Tax=Lentilitoribacter sp. EG35 TaxID=3234192 RepID=UPI00346035CE